MSEEAQVNIGALQQRVFGVEGGQRQLADSLSTLTSRVETLFAGLSTKIEERSRPQYTLLISLGLLGLAVIAAVGGLAYAPIRENQSDLKAASVKTNEAIASLANQTSFQINQLSKDTARDYVTVREVDGRSGRTRAEIDRLNTDLNSQEVSLRRAIEQADANLQRQIDDQKKAFGDTFSLRDALLQMQRRIDQLETLRSKP